MGVDSRRPLLPAPTESFVDTTGASTTGTDLATDISRRTDKTSYSIPDDGSPITISASRKSRHREHTSEGSAKGSRSSHHSQTSLLIEYFEGGKKSSSIGSRPSVRVRVTPSASRKLKENDRIHISESGSGRRKHSYTRRISLGTSGRGHHNESKNVKEIADGAAADDQSTSSLTDGGDDSNHGRYPPLEIEFANRGSSDASSRYIQPTSDISSMPAADSLLDGTTQARDSRRRRSHSVSGDEVESRDEEEDDQDDDLLKAPSRRRSRSLSRERIAQKAAEKISGHGTRDRTRSSKHQYTEGRREHSTSSSHRRRSSKYKDGDLASPGSSYLNDSIASGKLGDHFSFKSNTSRSSLYNPKLLETVEDAINRLILPEFKKLKMDQKLDSNKAKFDRSSHKSKDEPSRRLSKHASAPEVSKRHSQNDDSSHKTKESPSKSSDSRSPKSARERRREKRSSPRHERTSSGRRLSQDHQVGEIALKRRKSKSLRDAEAAKIVSAALTSTALKQHDSQSSVEEELDMISHEQRSLESPGVDDADIAFQRHNVAPMPFRSELDSELTRESILSQQSDNTATIHGEVVRGSPRNIGSQTPVNHPGTPTQNQQSGQRSYGSNASTPRSNRNAGRDEEAYEEETTPTARDVAAVEVRDQSSPQPQFLNIDFSNNRALSPIQSVASYEGNGFEQNNHHQSEADTTQPGNGAVEKDLRLSIESLSSAASTDLARSTRTADYSGDRRRPASSQHEESGAELGYEYSPRTSGADWDAPREEDDFDREANNFSPSEKRMTSYTDESYDDPGQEIAMGFAANAEYVESPLGVESAVASLLEPSILDYASNKSPSHSMTAPSRHYSPRLSTEKARELDDARDRGSPLKQRQDASNLEEPTIHNRMGVASPPQSIDNSSDGQDDEEIPVMGASALPDSNSPMPEVAHIMDSEESEINTNPSIIQGPIGGIVQGDRDHWPFEPTPPKSKHHVLSPDDEEDEFDVIHTSRDIMEPTVGAAGLGVIAEEQEQAYYPDDRGVAYGLDGKRLADQDLYAANRFGVASPTAKDEGYISGANHRSTSSATSDQKDKSYAAFAKDMGIGGPLDEGDDVYTDRHKRHLSGYSHGMSSPLYDSTTGKGIDRIQSKDIVALMDHLTVRDAQRNARDTEILVTLVRSAAEMRNSFENMKQYIAQQDDMLMEANNKQHDRTQSIIGGPRPLPTSGIPRSASKQSADFEEEIRSKKKNVFKRALKNLSSKNDLTHIEDMLLHLLAEVEALRAAQGGPVPVTGNDNTVTNRDQVRVDSRQSGSNKISPRSSMNDQRASQRGSSDNRISPVQEEDEDVDEPLTPHEQELLDNNQLSPNPRYGAEGRHRRGESVPLATPERIKPTSGSQSTDTTPKMSSEKSRKHTSFFPKISRWSKTTASSMTETLRNGIQTGRKDGASFNASRSNSDGELDNYISSQYYDHNGDDRIRSNTSFQRDGAGNRPPSPLVPSQLSENPKYRAHRDSINLQHPQPRQGPTARYQKHLESEAQNFGAPLSPHSEGWVSNPNLANHLSNGARHQSPLSDGGYSMTSSRASKVRDDGPLVPKRPQKAAENSGNATYAERMAIRNDDSNGSPSKLSPGRTGVPQRKPTGPRPITSAGVPTRRQYRGSPNPIDDDDDYY